MWLDGSDHLMRMMCRMTAHLPATVATAGGAEYLTPTEIAALLRLSKMTVYRLMTTGELRALRIGKQFRVPRAALDEYLERQQHQVA